MSFERMNKILEIDTENHVAVVQPGVTLTELDERTAEDGLFYPVYPGELSASLGGNVGTNAGGMRAIKYGVTRHHVLGLEAVLPTGEVIRTGGKFVKASTGYDLTQLIVGSEGTLALVTEATLKLQPRLGHQATVLAPFPDLASVAGAVPKIVGSGIGPLILEYIDAFTMGAITYTAELQLGIPDEIRDTAQAYLVVMLEDNAPARLDEDVEAAGTLLAELGALDVYVLPGAGRPQADRGARAGVLHREGPPAPTTSSTPCCRARRCPSSSRRCSRSRRATRRWSSAAGTRATATCTSRCSRRTPRCATRSCTSCSPPAWSSAARSPASTASATRRSGTSWS